jgi:REP element-mobilizing transposase RayT
VSWARRNAFGGSQISSDRGPNWRARALEVDVSHSLSLVFVHAVWATHLRQPWIADDCDSMLHSTIAGRLATLRGELLAYGASHDHVHVLFRAPLARSLATVVGAIKSETSLAIAGATFNPHFRWQVGYGAFSVGPRSVPTVISYVREQRVRHCTRELIADWEDVGRADTARSLIPKVGAIELAKPGGRRGRPRSSDAG